MSSQKSGCGCLPTIALSTLLIAGGGYAYKQGWHQSIIGGKLTPLSGAKVIPDEAIAVGFMTTKSQSWQELEKLELQSVNNALKELSSDLQEKFSSDDIDYQKDIAPWLGNAMFALLPANNSLEDADILIVLGIKNKLKAYRFYAEFQKEIEDKLTTYKGVKVYSDHDRYNEPVYTAILGNKIILSDSQAIVYNTIDTYKGEPSFASVPKNQVALKQPIKLKNNLFNFYFTGYEYLYKALAKEKFTSQEIDELFSINSFSFGMGTDEKKLSLQAFTEYKSNVDLLDSNPINNSIADLYPSDTLALLHGQGINTFWSTLAEAAEQEPEIKQSLNGMRSATKWVTGLDLDRDIFSWMDGEFSVGIVNTSASIIPGVNLNLGAGIILETSDRKTAENTLNTLNKKMSQQLGIRPKTKTINKQTVNQWLVPNSNVDISYSWIDENKLLLTAGNNGFASFQNKSQNTLSKNSKFSDLQKQLPQKNTSSFYVDISQIMKSIEQIPFPNKDFLYTEDNILTQIETIGKVSRMTDDTTSKTDLVINFK